MKNKFSIIDIETTGAGKRGNKIIEIAIINLDGDVIIEEFSTLINPERHIPVNITYLTGITNEMVTDAPKFYDIAKKIVEMTQERIFVAHNVFFDYNFIKNEFSELGYQFRREKLCTVRLARKYIPGQPSYSLGKLCHQLGIDIEKRHRALGDAKATTVLFQNILSQIDNQDFIQDESKKIILPHHVDREEYEKLPSQTGVYYFYDSSDKLLYIGKSKNLKKRVAQHFRPNLKRKKDLWLKNSIAKIKYKLFGHELAALLFECHEIKQKRPGYNISLKSKKFQYGVKLIKSAEGYLLPKIFTHIQQEDYDYLFKSKKTAQTKVENTFKSLLGDISLLDCVEAKIQRMVKLIGLEHYNSLIDKAFHFNLPKKSDFELELTKYCFLNVRNKKPMALICVDHDGTQEKIELIDDPQMKGILWAYLAKYKIPY